ncbi:serine hydrolase domain-containing protein [Actinoplanes sp. G11-F43]|uniref:serine hydrolase domain-containing protein n=1 Tax=Actinoplanes sp. G11-F43 TaxID=3424130 RepID=UPI003D347CB3
MRRTLLSTLVLSLLIALSPAPAQARSGGYDAYLREALEATGLPGMSVVVTRGDQVLHAAGLGHDADGRPVTADTPMRVASVSKSFTAATVLSLVGEGRVALDQPVVGYLPEFRTADPRSDRITVRHLLDQTSGLSDRTLDVTATQRAADLSGYLAVLRDGRLAADPGTHYEYCNVNFDVAARLVEVVDGRDFADAVRARIFEPLGMTTSGVGDRQVRPAAGFNSIYGAWVSRAELPGFRFGGSGSVVSTATDMGRWLIGQTGQGPRFLTPAALTTLHRSWTDGDYAMGWSRHEVDGRRLLVHTGNLFTYTAIQAFDPHSGLGLAVLLNSASLYEDNYDVLVGLLAIADGRQPAAPGGTRQLIDLGLAAGALIAIGLGVLGVVRAGRWAQRARWWRMGGVLLPVVVLATYPQWVSFLSNGRTVTWAQVTYFPAPLTITLGVAAAAGLATAAARLIRLRAVRSGG